jgi:hypothetical protein
VLDERGAPSVTAMTKIRPPNGRMGPLLPAERASLIAQSPVAGAYDTLENRESAYEKLQARVAAKAEAAAAAAPASTQRAERPAPAPRASTREGIGEAMAKSVVRAASSSIGRQVANALVRGILGSLAGGTTRRRR